MRAEERVVKRAGGRATVLVREARLRRAERAPEKVVLASAAGPRTLGNVGLRKIARAVRQAGVDADVARRTASSPEFRRAVTKDRRSALSRYATVRDAIRDRERIAAAKSGAGSAATRSTISRPKTSRNGSTGKKRG